MLISMLKKSYERYPNAVGSFYGERYKRLVSPGVGGWSAIFSYEMMG